MYYHNYLQQFLDKPGQLFGWDGAAFLFTIQIGGADQLNEIHQDFVIIKCCKNGTHFRVVPLSIFSISYHSAIEEQG